MHRSPRLDEQDRYSVLATIEFLKTRLAESGTIEWALGLKPERTVERRAVSCLLRGPAATQLKEPWATAWRLIEESWSKGTAAEDTTTAVHGFRRRLRAKDRSGALVSAIADIVRPRLEVSSRIATLRTRRPKTVDDLLSVRLTSCELIDLSVLKLASIADPRFLVSLATSLDAVVNDGLDAVDRIRRHGEPEDWRWGTVNRVRYTQMAPREDASSEPDAYNCGIAPAVKLLHSVVMRVAEIEPKSARLFVDRWRLADSSVHIRLWASAARDRRLASAKEVGSFLLTLSDRQFWRLREFPEVAELRAVRFAELDDATQAAVVARIRRRPPRHQWPKSMEHDRVKMARRLQAVCELKRIQLAGAALPRDAAAWLDRTIEPISDLATMTVDSGFPGGVTVSSISPDPDDRYDALQGVTRLRTLEAALAGTGRTRRDSGDRADDWLQQSGKTTLLLGDLESADSSGDEFPHLWNRFLSVHASEGIAVGGQAAQPAGESDRLLRLLARLSDNSLSVAVDGISEWLYAYREQVIDASTGVRLWLRVWPIAVRATDEMRQERHEDQLVVWPEGLEKQREPTDLDVFNTPAGKLVGTLLVAVRSTLDVSRRPAAGKVAREMLDAVAPEARRSGGIVQRRLVEDLPYLLRADCDWTKAHLLPALLQDDDATPSLWRALARRTQFTEVLGLLGERAVERAVDSRLGRETRRGLVVSLVIESLHAFQENREPAVPNVKIQQMLRSLGDEGRAVAANAIQRFVDEVTGGESGNDRRESIFRAAAAPFLRFVWPQERSLTTPGVSRALAVLPATSGGAFAEAVEVIEPFLVPFDCWSLLDYGLYGKDGEGRKLSRIDDDRKAGALLRLLDLTVGAAESAVVPDGLADALDQIKGVHRSVVDSPEFRRLSAAARR